MNLYKHIVFDIDGTLIDTEYAILHSLQDTLLSLDKNYSLEKLSFALGITGKDALKQLKVNDIPNVLKLWDRNMRNYKQKITFFDGIKEVLQELIKRGYELGIVTSKTREEFSSDFDCFGITNYFHCIICADDTLEHKPNPEPLLKYIELTNVKSYEMMYIGDSKYDAMCSKSANVDFGLAVWGHHLKDLSAAYYFDTPKEILKELNPIVNL